LNYPDQLAVSLRVTAELHCGSPAGVAADVRFDRVDAVAGVDFRRIAI